MKLNTMRFGLVAGSLAFAASLIAAGVYESGDFKVNGNSVTTDYITHNGKVYMPVSDVANALGMQVVKHSASSFELVPAGGANQINGLEGKVGQTLVTSHYKFSVSKFFTTDHYTKQFTSGTDDAPDGKTLAVAVIKIKNATNKTLYLSMDNDQTALTDQDEHSYPPMTLGGADWPSRNPELLPGAAFDFALVTPIPSNAKPKDLVFDLSAMGVQGHTIFRIHLT